MYHKMYLSIDITFLTNQLSTKKNINQYFSAILVSNERFHSK